ncbi:hypothetical protein H072_2944 [Dactylellina haptotyla CBS 200.50]|uniref:Apple domain-containing protein n=1 Tax=Dactylellina haptotyla (strain CBS 200.50) TaxID=1284197 RepID=S8AJR0_DACHA|nr:hypothetical protein H072_2944 [Dactylellina haptotyla CBS 200.50]
MRFTVLSFLAVPVFLEGVAAAGYYNVQCMPAAKSCATLKYEAASCTSFFAKSKVPRPTCTSTHGTVTVTKKMVPTTTSTTVKTSTVYAYITKQPVVVIPGFRTVTVTSTPPVSTVTETEQAVDFTTSFTTETTEITDATVSETSIVIATAAIPGATCSRLPDKRRRDSDILGKRANIPKCCSCFLTATITARSTKTVTTTLPKVTVKKTSTKRVTVTRTVTKAKTSTNLITVTVTQTAVASTETAHETTTSTSTIPSTVIETISRTATETALATETILPPSLCGNPFTFNGRNAFAYDGATASNDGDGITNISDCCTKCYTTQNCANYMFDNIDNVCNIYIVNSGATTDRCANDICPYGHVSGTFVTQPTNELYGPGPCGGGIIRN